MNLLDSPLTYFSTFVYRGSSHRRKSAACPKFHMVWLYRSPFLVGRRGVISSFKLFLHAFATSRGRGKKGRYPVGSVRRGEGEEAGSPMYSRSPLCDITVKQLKICWFVSEMMGRWE
jgi:hypothetical protein